MKNKNIVVWIAWFLIIGGFWMPAYAQDLREMTLASGRTYWVHLPVQPQEEHPPLVIALHGGGSNGRAMARFSGLNDTADREGFVVVYPDGSGRLKNVLTWNAGLCCAFAAAQQVDDVGFIRSVIADCITQFSINPAAVFVTGMSNGAMMAYRLAVELPDQIRAIAPVAGTMTIPLRRIRTPVPIIHFHGTADTHVPYEGGRGEDSTVSLDYIAVDDTIQAWVAAHQIQTPPIVDPVIDAVNDGMSVEVARYRDATGIPKVVLYKIIGGGHTWPGQTTRTKQLGATTQEIDANQVMWDFFEATLNRK